MTTLIRALTAYFQHYYGDELPPMATSHTCLILCYCGYY